MATSVPMLPPVRVVVVEDHEITREGIKAALALDEHILVVGEAVGSCEAIGVIQHLRPDIVILDIRLREGSGIDVCKGIKKTAPMTRVLVLTAYDDEQYVSAFACLGARGYLSKSASPEELCQAVRGVACGWLMFAPCVASKLSMLLEDSKEPEPKRISYDHALTPREMEILQWMARGLRNREIAQAMNIAVKTVEAHGESVLLKLGARNRTEAVVTGMENGWIKRVEYGDAPLVGTLAMKS